MPKTNNDIINEYWKFGAELGTAVENTSEEFDIFMKTIQHSESEVQELKNRVKWYEEEEERNANTDYSSIIETKNEEIEKLKKENKELKDKLKDYEAYKDWRCASCPKIEKLQKENEELKEELKIERDYNIRFRKENRELKEYIQKLTDKRDEEEIREFKGDLLK